MAQKLSLDLLRFYANGQQGGMNTLASCTDERSFYIFQAECFRK